MASSYYSNSSFTFEPPQPVPVAVQRDLRIYDENAYMVVETWESPVCANIHLGTLTTTPTKTRHRDFSKKGRIASTIMMSLGAVFLGTGGIYHAVGLGDGEVTGTLTDIFVYGGAASLGLGALIFLPPDKFKTTSDPLTVPAAAVEEPKTWQYCEQRHPISLEIDVQITQGENRFKLNNVRTDAEGKYIVPVPTYVEIENLARACGQPVTVKATLPRINTDAEILSARAQRSSYSPRPSEVDHALPEELATAQLELGDAAGQPSSELINTAMAKATVSRTGMVRDAPSDSPIGRATRKCLDRVRGDCIAGLNERSIDDLCFTSCRSQIQRRCVKDNDANCAGQVVMSDGNVDDPQCRELLSVCDRAYDNLYSQVMRACYDSCQQTIYREKCGP